MKAIQFTGYGDISEKVIISEIQKPILNKDEVLIETRSVSVNPLDIKVIEGKLKAVRKFKLPATLGYDVSGIVVDKDKNVTDFNIGDEVFSKVNKQGTFTEFVVVHKDIICAYNSQTYNK